MNLANQATRAEQATAALLRSSPLFDADFYLAQVSAPAAADDPALHYVLHGEAQGAAASARFNAADYATLNPDLQGIAQNLLVHYTLHGRAECRKHTFLSDALVLDNLRLDPAKPTVLLLLDGAGRNDTSQIGWTLARELKLTRNVCAVLRCGGPLMPLLQADTDLLVPVPSDYVDDPREIARLAERLKASCQPTYAVAFGIATRLFGVAVKEAGVPVVALISDFADDAQPYAFSEFYRTCDTLVFVSEGARQSSLQRREYRLLAQRTTTVLRYGALERLPPESHGHVVEHPVLPALTAGREAPCFTVLGSGPVQVSEGVDLFIATAVALKALAPPEFAFRFVWRGEQPVSPDTYASLLSEQLAQSGLGDRVISFTSADDLDLAFSGADAFLMTARRDAPAFVGVAAALSGLPVVCFAGASGLAEVLATASRTRRLVVPYLDISAAAERLLDFALDQRGRLVAMRATQKMALRSFSRVRHAAALDAIGQELAVRRAAREAQAAELEPEDAFDQNLYFGVEKGAILPRRAAVRRYLEDTLNAVWSGPAVESHHPRRPVPGFNPFIYAHEAPDFDAEAGLDPLVDFIRKDRPKGRWLHDIIRLDSDMRVQDEQTELRVALHGHFHYVENFADLLDALSVNRHPMDLFLTTTSESAGEVLRLEAERYSGGQVQVIVGANLGRDIGPFLSLLDRQFDGYDVVGHVHGKRSSHGQRHDPRYGDRWRNFLWQHLLGPAAPAADVILACFAAEPRLGLVFPENEHLIGWEQTREIADAVAPRIGLSGLPEHLEFPVGTMFWARTSALRLLKEARFSTVDYQAEPLPLDGTLLHAIERLITPIVEAASFYYCTTYFPGFGR